MHDEQMKLTGQAIAGGQAILGIELGSTRIKAVLIGEDKTPLASGAHTWENKLVDGTWTYSLEDVWAGIQDSYRQMQTDVRAKYGVHITHLKAIGISAMMHGYLAIDRDDKLLTPFRTWRNTTTQQAASELSELFAFNIPQRWSIAHLQQAIANKEAHVPQIRFLTTLAGYVHWKLTGQKVLGIGDASGMFPVDSAANDYDSKLLERFDGLHPQLNMHLRDLLPKALSAGEIAGILSEAGAKLLDASGSLQAGVPLCPPEGDADTGMVATNSVAPCRGNISAGTSIFAMIVLERPLKRYYEEVDMIYTPDGSPVAMVHCNNGSSDLDAWVALFEELTGVMGTKADRQALYGELYRLALEGEADCGGLLAYNYLSGEHITQTTSGRPLFVRMSNSRFTLANFMRSHLLSMLCTLRLGMDILFKQESVRVESLLGHGGLFKTQRVAQQLMAAALQAPVGVMATAGEGGAWGIALLADFMTYGKAGDPLGDYLWQHVFRRIPQSLIEPNPEDVEGFKKYLEIFQKGLVIERSAIETLS